MTTPATMTAITPRPKLAFAAAMGSATAATLLGCDPHEIMTHVSTGLSLIEHFTRSKPDPVSIEVFFQGGRDHLSARMLGTLAMFPNDPPLMAQFLTPDLLSRLEGPMEHLARAIPAGRPEALDEVAMDRSKDFWSRLDAGSGRAAPADGSSFDGASLHSAASRPETGRAEGGAPSSPTLFDIARNAVKDLENILRAWGGWSMAWKVFSKMRSVLSSRPDETPEAVADRPGYPELPGTLQQGTPERGAPGRAAQPAEQQAAANDGVPELSVSEDPLPLKSASNLNYPPPPAATRRHAPRVPTPVREVVQDLPTELTP